jgi:hypothetical protein
LEPGKSNQFMGGEKMPFSPFNANDFALMQQVREGQLLPQPLAEQGRGFAKRFVLVPGVRPGVLPQENRAPEYARG